MGEYIYKTTPASVREVTIIFNNGATYSAAVGEYAYAYKPWPGNERENKKLHNRTVAPAQRAFARSPVIVPKYGVQVSDKHKHIRVGDAVFDANYRVSLSDYSISRVGFVISLEPNGKDERTLAQRIDPDLYGYSFLRPYVADVIMANLPNGGTLLSGNPLDYLPEWKAKLQPEDRTLFETLEQLRHPQTALREN